MFSKKNNSAIFRKNLIFGKNWFSTKKNNFRLWTKNSIFDQHFDFDHKLDFWQKFNFRRKFSTSTKIFDLMSKLSESKIFIFGEYFDFRRKFIFLMLKIEKILIFLNYWIFWTILVKLEFLKCGFLWYLTKWICLLKWHY